MAISLAEALEILDSQGKNALWEAVYTIANEESKFANRIYKHLFWLKREKKQHAEEIGNDTIEKVVDLIMKLREDFMYEQIDKTLLVKIAFNKSRDSRKKKWHLHEIFSANLETIMNEYQYQIPTEDKIGEEDLYKMFSLIEKDTKCYKLITLFHLHDMPYQDIVKTDIFIGQSEEQLRKKKSKCMDKYRLIFKSFLE